MKSIAELAPWECHSLGASPFVGFYPFNPSIVRIPYAEGPGTWSRWLCSIRLANYHLPGSVAQPARDGGAPIRNRLLVMEIDPATWKAVRTVEVDLKAACGKIWNPSLGFEDLRLVYCDGALHATASAMRIETDTLEIVLLRFDGQCRIVDVDALRGPWSGTHQKNWSPFAYTEGTMETFRALYSPLAGGVHERAGRIFATSTPAQVTRVAAPSKPGLAHAQRHFHNGAMEVQIRNSRTQTAHEIAGVAEGRHARLALRGGTQLVHVGGDVFLGLAHGCQVGFHKYYWHQFYTVNARGDLLSLSEPMKLSPVHGIEFAAGMAIDPASGSLVISYGIEDDSAWIGVTNAVAVMSLLRPVGDAGKADPICNPARSMSADEKNHAPDAIVLSE